MTYATRTLIVALTFAVLPQLAMGQLESKSVLPLDVVKQIASVAHTEAAQNQWSVVIAIVDDGGHLLYLERMNDVQTGSVEVAIAKAKSAVAFRRPTKAWADLLASGGSIGLLGLEGAVPLEGGLPLIVGEQVVGAIGVSGVTSEQDSMIAAAGADALEQIARTGGG